MNRIFIFIYLIALSFPTFAQISPETTLPHHPRLFLLKGEEKILKKGIQRDASWQKIHNFIIDECGLLLNTPLSQLVKDASGKRILPVSRENLKRIFFLSYAYRLTGDNRYAERAEKEMIHIADYSSWNPSHFLDVAEMTMAMAIGYDWLYSFLSPASREKIASAIIKKGVNESFPENKPQPYWINGTNNWNQVCNTGMAIGALAVFETIPQRAAETINRAITGIPACMGGYAPDGAYPEGITYWNYGTTYNVFLIDALNRVFGENFGLSQTAGFLPSGLYSQQMITPALNQYNYGDTKSKITFNPASFWFYSQTKDPAQLYMQNRVIAEKELDDPEVTRFIPASLVWGVLAKASLSKVNEPVELAWMGRGSNPVAVFRSSWSDPNGLYLGFKAGSSHISHGHQDAGSFFFEADGISWALELGQEDYARIEAAGVRLWDTQRWDIFRYNNFAHNVITINGRNHTRSAVSIDRFNKDDSQAMSASSDLTPVYDRLLGSYRRTVTMKEQKTVVISDSIATLKQFTKIRWNMATEADEMIPVDNRTVLLKKDGKQLYMQVEGIDDIRFKTWSAQSENDFDSPNPGVQFVGFESVLPMESQIDLKIIFSKMKTK